MIYCFDLDNTICFTINQLTKMAVIISNKKIRIKILFGQEFISKYGFKYPKRLRGRNSDNKLYESKLLGKLINPYLKALKNIFVDPSTIKFIVN